MQRLFSVNKIGVFVDGYGPGIEKRSGDLVSVLSVKCRVQPFDSKLAAALDEGVGESSNIRATVFNLTSGEPKKNFTKHYFKLPLDRQNLELFASPDTDRARILLLQAKISGCYVRTQKDTTALALVFRATFGPVGRDELELVHSLHRSQTFITFTEAEPLLEHEDDGADDLVRPPAGKLPEPMFTDERDAIGKAVDAHNAKMTKRGRKGKPNGAAAHA